MSSETSLEHLDSLLGSLSLAVALERFRLISRCQWQAGILSKFGLGISFTEGYLHALHRRSFLEQQVLSLDVDICTFALSIQVLEY